MKSFNYSKTTDEKWQRKWQETKLYKFDETKIADKFYLLEMFSYPSAKNLHIGHWWNYGLSDSYGRFKRMQGYQVFHPPGFDAFGLPAENYAIQTGVHPKDSTFNNITTMETQLRAMGTTYDWDYNIITCDEDYYKWTQWLFLKLYEKGLAYRNNSPVNWCPSCMTTLANEQAVDGKCERCETIIVKRSMTQWFFKITEYTEELLSGLDTLDWPEKAKLVQKNWIGKSVGKEIDFKCGDEIITIFTTQPDALKDVVNIILAPENLLVDKLTTPEYKNETRSYCEQAAKKSEIERMAAVKERTGVFTGSYAEHPVTGDKIPIWIANYILQNQGADLLTQKKSEISLPFDTSKDAVRYRLRDWLVSRQRYWGAPIPIIYCEDCGVVPVPEKDLPVKLPYDVEFQPNGRSPLSSCEEFINAPCPVCGKPAKRDTDTLDTFVCSSWYYLRFYDNQADVPFNTNRVSQIMPVDKYVGGIEHASMHMLYARFITKALRDMGYLSFDEPFPSIFHQGIITGADGKKMSKRDGAVSPDEIIDKYGSDILRMYLGFGFSYLDGGPWDDNGIKAIIRFVSRISKILESFICFKHENTEAEYICDETLEYTLNYTIKHVGEALDIFSFNTAIARIMEFINAIQSYQKGGQRNLPFEATLIKNLILLLAPLAPHLSEELWEYAGYTYSVHNQSFPSYDEGKLARNMLDIAVQVNGSLKNVIPVPNSFSEDEIKKAALNDDKVQTYISQRVIKNIIYIKNKLLNIVCE